MLAQLDRIASLTGPGSVSIGIIPQHLEVTMVAGHGFVLYDDIQDGDPFVSIELVSGPVRIFDPEAVTIYRERLSRLRDAAVYGEEARALLTRIMHAMREE